MFYFFGTYLLHHLCCTFIEYWPLHFPGALRFFSLHCITLQVLHTYMSMLTQYICHILITAVWNYIIEIIKIIDIYVFKLREVVFLCRFNLMLVLKYPQRDNWEIKPIDWLKTLCPTPSVIQWYDKIRDSTLESKELCSAWGDCVFTEHGRSKLSSQYSSSTIVKPFYLDDCSLPDTTVSERLCR